MHKKPIWPWLIGLAVLLAVIMYVTRTNTPAFTPPHDDIPCIAEGVPLTQHLHPVLDIYVNNVPEAIPSTLGHFTGCEKVIHMHDENPDWIHVESQDNTTYTLGDFFRVWGEPIQRAGYSLTVTVDGTVQNDAAGIFLRDPQHIEMRYVSLPK